MDCQPRGMRIVARDKVDTRLHQPGDEMDVAREPIELDDDQAGVPQPAGSEGCGDLRPIVALAGFDLAVLGDEYALGAGDVASHRLALRFEAEPRGALLVGRDA